MAQVTRAAFAASLTTKINDNTSNEITALDVREVLTDLEDSAAWYDEVTNAANLTSGTLADARVAQSNVTQHQAALSITESQISDLGTYQTALDGAVITAVSGAAGDGVLVQDASAANGLRKVLWENLPAGGGGMTSFSVTGDSGTPEVIGDGNTLDIAGGTGITTAVSATDTVTVNIDSTVATLTGTQTLTNKTLTAPTFSGTITGTYTLGGTPTLAATGVTLADAGDIITATNVETAFTEAFGLIDGNTASISSLNSSKADLDQLMVYTRDLVTSAAADLREVSIDGVPVAVDPSDTVLWRNYPTRPANMEANDLWLGPPGAAVNPQTGTTYQFVLNDGGGVVTVANASPHVLTIPENATVAFPTGTIINVYRKGVGTVTLTGATNVTVNGVLTGSVAISAQWQGVAALKVDTNEWIVSGAIS